MAVSTLVDGRVLSPHHGGAFRSGQPSVIVVHSAETPIQTGRAYQSARYVITRGLSAHYFVDPGEIICGLDESLVGWAAGNANQRALHVEFAGYARYQRDQWLKGDTESGTAMIDRGRKLIADIAKRHGIPLRFLTDAELRAGQRGLTTHAQCSRVLGGTDHTDPGSGFPLPLLTLGEDVSIFDETVKYQSLKDGSSTGKTTETTFRNWIQWITKDITAVVYRVGVLREEVAALREEVAAIKAGTAPSRFEGTVKLEAK